MPTGVLEEFRETTAARIGESMRQLEDLERNRPTPERLVELKVASRLIGTLKAPERLPESNDAPPKRERIFP